jgi:superfamily II DNA/RNA helicase
MPDPEAACDTHPFADRDELLNDFTTAAVDASAQPHRPHGPGGQDAASPPQASQADIALPQGVAVGTGDATEGQAGKPVGSPDLLPGDAMASASRAEPVRSVGMTAMDTPDAQQPAVPAVQSGIVPASPSLASSTLDTEASSPGHPDDAGDASATMAAGAGAAGAGAAGAGAAQGMAPDSPATGGADGSANDDAVAMPALVGAEKSVPVAVVSEEVLFSDLGLSEPIVRAVEEMGYRHPTPIQAQAIPVVLAGRDVLGVAQTGTGKTAGFTLPMLDILAGSRSRARMPRSLILEPTRELALQVAENFVKYGKYLKLNHALLIGGESLNDQKSALMKGVDVLIATPGRLLDLFERGGMMLTDARILVIDEADRMLDMGFIPDVEKIVSFLPANRQTLFFSATMAGEIRRLADAFLRNPKEITVSRAASVAPLITEGLAIVAEDDKGRALREIIATEAVQNALIFCNRKRDVDVLNKTLGKHGFSVGALHGDLAQSVRFATLERFKAGEIRLLVCSDVAARGIDIGGLSHVFNFDVPHHSEDYVHRIGRTGRAGLTGHAYTIAAPTDRANLEAIEKLTGHAIPRMTVAGVATAEWEESDGKRRRGRGKPSAARVADPVAAPVVAPDAVLAAAEAGRVETGRVEDVPGGDSAARRPEGRRRGRGRGGDRARQAEAAQGGAALAVPGAMQPEVEPRVVEERAPARTRDEPAAFGVRRDGVAAAAPAEDRSRGEDRFRRDGERFRRDGRRRDEDLGPSVLGFGGETPAFMQLPTRASRLERLAQAPVEAIVQKPARVVPILPAPAAEPVLTVADPAELVAEPVIVETLSVEAVPIPAEASMPAAVDPEPPASLKAQVVPEAAVPEVTPEPAAAQENPALEPDAAAVADAQPTPRQRAPRRTPATPRAPHARKAAAAPVVAEVAPDPDAVAIRTYRPARDPAVKRAAHSPAVPAKRSRRLLGGKVELLEEPATDAAIVSGTARSGAAARVVDAPAVPDETAPE